MPALQVLYKIDAQVEVIAAKLVMYDRLNSVAVIIVTIVTPVAGFER